MNRSELIEKLKETFQSEKELTEDIALADIEEWDSLAVLSIISLYDTLFSKILEGEDIVNCKTVSDLLALVNDQLEK